MSVGGGNVGWTEGIRERSGANLGRPGCPNGQLGRGSAGGLPFLFFSVSLLYFLSFFYLFSILFYFSYIIVYSFTKSETHS